MFYDNRPGKRVSRQELYDLVWSEPLRTIAPRFEVSGVGLRKICLRANIPLPPVGHWEKLRHGKRTKRQPQLPVAEPTMDNPIMIRPSRNRKVDLDAILPDDIARLVDAERAKPVPLPMPKKVRTHPIVARWITSDDSTPSKIESRRRRILSVLFHEIEKRQGRVTAEARATFKVTLAGEVIDISLYQPDKQVKVPLTAEERRQSWNENREWNIKYESSGSLSLRIEESFNVPTRRHWHDAPDKPLENQLRSVIVGLLIASALVRKRRLEREEWERERYRTEQERAAREERRRQEQERLNVLLAETASWEKARLIRSYVNARLDAVQGSGTPSDEVEVWANWARQAADRLDPLYRRESTA
jgi:hypothetical protein